MTDELQAMIAKIRKLLKKVPPSPWTTCLNAKEMFGIEYADWGCVYANVKSKSGIINVCQILRVNCNLVTEKEADATRTRFFETGDPGNPGLMGAITEYIAAVNPDCVQGLLDEIDRLNKDADWLAERMKCDNTFTPEQETACIAENGPCAKCLREAARRNTE